MTLDADACRLAALPTAFTFAQARELGTPIRSLYALRDAGLIGALGRGLYPAPMRSRRIFRCWLLRSGRLGPRCACGLRWSGMG